MRVAPNEVEHAVVNVLRFFEARGALVFCGTREAVRHLHGALRERGFDAVGLSGEMTQRERTDALQALRDGRARVCVATDVAARGLDLPDLGLVIHADLPVNRQAPAASQRPDRAGRAQGRLGAAGPLHPPPPRRAAAGFRPHRGGLERPAERRGDPGRRPGTPAARPDPDRAAGRGGPGPGAPGDGPASAPEAIAAALIRLHRSRLPAPEDLYDPGEPRAGGREERGAAASRAGAATTRPAPAEATHVWFRMAVGRNSNADPKWLVPMICRRGHVTKKDIGPIRIFDRETKFEIARDAADRFIAAVKAAPDEPIRIEPAGAPGPRKAPPADARPAKPYKPGPKGKRSNAARS